MVTSTYVNDSTAFQEYVVFRDTEGLKVIEVDNKENIPWSLYVGVLGLAGARALSLCAGGEVLTCT